MLKNKPVVAKIRVKFLIFAFCLLPFLLTTACRYDMQDQPRYKALKQSDWFSDGRSWQLPPDGTIARGNLDENKALYQGKLENATGTSQTNAQGQPITFPEAVTDFPIPVTQETLDNGQIKFKVYCSVCHGAFGNGDGMIVRRGFPKPPSYHDDRLRNAPVGHFFDVATNGWGKMNGYSAQVSVSDRWAIVAYIRALQISQNPNGIKALPATATTQVEKTVQTAATPVASPSPSVAKPVANSAVKKTEITNTSSNVKTTTVTTPAKTVIANTNTKGGQQ